MVGSLLRRSLIVFATLPVFAGGALAQTNGKGTADSKPLLENDRMRVIEMVFKPGDQAGGGSRPNRFVYALTDGALVFSPPGKRPYELSFSAGEALWLPSESTTTVNESEKEVRALVVEFKDGGGAPRVATRGGKVKTTGKGKGRQTLTLQIKNSAASAAKTTVSR